MNPAHSKDGVFFHLVDHYSCFLYSSNGAFIRTEICWREENEEI